MSEQSEQVVIVHISDLHVGAMYGAGDDEGRCKRLVRDFNTCLKEIGRARADLLVISGDLTERGQYKEFQAFREQFLELLAQSFDQILIVPGNHDIDRNVVEKKDNGDHPLRQFQEQIVGKEIWRKPDAGDDSDAQHGTILRSYAIGNERKPATSKKQLLDHMIKLKGFVEVVPFCSVEFGGIPQHELEKLLAGQSDGSKATLDPAYFGPEVIKAYRSTFESEKPKGIRIAVLHHNPIPFSYETAKSYSFIDAGAFHRLLTLGHFQVVLHGHQHEAHVSYLAHPPSFSELGDSALSAAGRGLHSIGVASFGGPYVTNPGFNVLVLSKDEKHGGVSVELQSVSCTYGGAQGVGQARTSTYSWFAPSTARKKLEPERVKFIERAQQLALSAQSLAEIRRELSGEADKEPDFFTKLRGMRRDLIDVRAAYALSVFPPKAWTEKRLTESFLRDATESIAQAAAYAKLWEGNRRRKRFDDACPSLHFRFSRPLHSALDRALENARRLDVAGRVRNALEQADTHPVLKDSPRLQHFLHQALGIGPVGHKNTHNSVSVWDNVPLKEDHEYQPMTQSDLNSALEGQEDQPDVFRCEKSRSALPWDPQLAAREYEAESLRHVFEFARIALWQCEDFSSAEECLATIEFHELCCFPMFWLDPARTYPPAQGKTDSIRAPHGHFTALALRRGPAKQAVKQPKWIWNNRDGKQVFEAGERDIDVTQAWNGNLPKGMDTDPTPLHEFVFLLTRPSVLLAVDAWALNVISTGPENRLRKLVAELGS